MKKLYVAQLKINDTTYYVASSMYGLAFVGTPNQKLTEIQKFYPQVQLVEGTIPNQQVLKQLTEYLEGQRTQFDLALDWSLATPFQQAVWRDLQQIPYGQTVSYSELANIIKQPQAVRAVATAVGRNPILIAVPCHRVIQKNGDLGQYRGGVSMKEKLLKMEGFLKD